MKVALFGGTGFVGSYIVRELVRKGFIPKILVRSGSLSKIISPCEVVRGDIKDKNAIIETIRGTEVVIYTIGIIREFPKKGVTFKELQLNGLKRCIEIARKIDVKRFILMSANGVRSDGTAYQTTKWQADEALTKSGLNWTIFRPSLIFGDPRGEGRPEFCTQIRDDMLSMPFPAPLFYNGLLPFNSGLFSMSPIHVKNVAEFFVKSINSKICEKNIFDLGGPEVLTWKEIIHKIALASGKRTWKIPAPVVVIKIAASILDRFKWFPVTRDQLTMLMESNTVSANYFDDFSINPKKFNLENLEYLK
ncbi:NAD-dependent epimerase/dehydratase family protein [Candidatus Marinimicrobia bacterium PRS2]|nr:NAD-dependent epimerase/dehydratase family protein [Candidatus Marinimicrobia bacterium PRS2]